jgi:hypothetical protein
MPITTGGVEYYNQKFIDTVEHYDEFIQERSIANPNIWRDRIPRGTFTLFEGLTKKTNIWRGGLGEQAGLSNWDKIQVSRTAAGEDQGVDACNADPQTYNYAWETLEYTGFKSSWQSMPICLNDIKFTAEAKEQCRLQAAQCSYITMTVWENWSREQYVKQAVDAGHTVILCEGGMDFIDDTSVRFVYDPFATDTDGDTFISFDADLKLSTLNWSYFDYLHNYLSDQAPEAALSNDGGMPIFGLMVDQRDVDKHMRADADLREDFRYAMPSVLIDGYPVTVKKFRGWGLIHDSRQMRFRFDHIDSNGKAICKRVKPMKEGRAVTIGNVPVANPDYYKAEVALGVILMNNVLQNQVTPTVPNMGSGMVFGAKPGYNGTFAWINEYDRVLNPLRKTGYFFAEFEIFPKPLMYSTEAVVFIYRRCPQTWNTGCEIETLPEAATAAVPLASAAIAADVDATVDTVKLTLTKVLDARIGDTVTIARSTSSSDTAVIAQDGLAPTYVFASESTIGAYTDYAVGATVTVS